MKNNFMIIILFLHAKKTKITFVNALIYLLYHLKYIGNYMLIQESWTK